MTSEQTRPRPDWDGAMAAYRAGRIVSHIIAEFGVDRTRFYDRVHLEKVPLRRAGRRGPSTLPLPRERAEESGQELHDAPSTGWAHVASAGAEPTDAADLSSMAARMARLVSHNMTQLERNLSAGRAGDPERAARTLSLHARMLAGLEKLNAVREEDAGTDGIDPPPRTLVELRDELRRHLERIREEERSRALPRELDAG